MAGAAHRSDGRLGAWHEDAHSIRTHAGEERLAKAGPGAEIEAAQWWLSVGGWVAHTRSWLVLLPHQLRP
jgi:hypothetical protein